LAQDQPALRSSPAVGRFRVFEEVDADGTDAPRIIESIEVESMEAWESALRTPRLTALGEEFRRLVDESTVVQFRCHEIGGP
jgi:hypothetical protein